MHGRSTEGMFCVVMITLALFSSTGTSSSSNVIKNRRRFLHQPFFPVQSISPPIQAPLISPQPGSPQLPKLPSTSSSSSSSFSSGSQNSFFPPYNSTAPPPFPTNALTTVPANISSLLLPQSSSSKHYSLIGIAISLSLLSAAVIVALTAFIYYRHHRKFVTASKTSRLDSLRLYPPNTVTSDGRRSPHRKLGGVDASSCNSDFLYMGTLSSSNEGGGENDKSEHSNSNASDSNKKNVDVGVTVPSCTGMSATYQKLGSPELKPLPPLPRFHSLRNQRSNVKGGSSVLPGREDKGEEHEEFFSPRGSLGRKECLDRSPSPTLSPPYELTDSISRRVCVLRFEGNHCGSRSFNSRTASYPYSNVINSVTVSVSPSSTTNNSLSLSNASSSPDSRSLSLNNLELSPKQTLTPNLPPPPPLTTPSFPGICHNLAPAQQSQGTSLEKVEDAGCNISSTRNPRPKLKPLHWEKVRASTEQVMVWDRLRPSSFQLNEEMMETLFMLKTSNSNANDGLSHQINLPACNQLQNKVLDLKSSQNIAILLKALNLTVDEVCEALWEGNSDTLGTELLESLLKMAQNQNEQCEVRVLEDESPFKLGPAEKFLKDILKIPFAFKRVDAMLYISNFDSEVEYLKFSFNSLEAACHELRSSRMFLKLLEVVLKTGNRMNDGTNRGNAHAFKLDTLLKLIDIKGADGKTTLLHFVVQEIVKSEGSWLYATNHQQPVEKMSEQSSLRDDMELRKLGLQVVSGLSGELTNVKKAAAMDSNVLSSEFAKLAGGIAKVVDVVKINEEIALKERSRKFSECMHCFLLKAEEEISKIQAQEEKALNLLKKTTEYFYGNSVLEEGRPCQIFVVVKDFLATLDRVCKEVGRVNERTLVGNPAYPGASNLSCPVHFAGV